MSVCNKCKVERTADQYETYWHSSHQKHYTRRICNVCTRLQKKEYKLKIKANKLLLEQLPQKEIIIQPDAPELIVEDFSTNPDYKKCVLCLEYKNLKEFYFAKTVQAYQSKCKKCHNQVAHQKQAQAYEYKKINCGGSERVPPKAGVFADEYQKEQTFWVMKLMGWTYNEEHNKWFKDGIKELQDGKVKWFNIPEKIVKPKKRYSARPHVIIDMKLLNKYRDEDKLTYKQIAVLMGVSNTTIKKYYHNGKV